MKVVNVKNVAIGEGMTKICVPLVAPTDYDVDYQFEDHSEVGTGHGRIQSGYVRTVL